MDRAIEQRSIRKMTTNYVVVLIILAVIAFGNFYIMRASIQGEQTTAAVINVSGRQRMLLQRSAMFAQRVLVTRDEASRIAFLDTVKLMQRSHEGLIRGDKTLNLPGITSSGVRSIFFDPPVNLDKQVRDFIKEARAFANDPVDEFAFNNPHLQYIENAATDGLLDSFDMLVRKYQSESEGKITWIATLTALLFAISIAVLIFMGLAVFRPMVRRIMIEMERISGAEARISAVVGSMMDGLVTFDDNGIVETVNMAAVTIFGFSEEQAVGQSVNRLIPKLLRYGRVDADSGGAMREVNARRMDGAEFPLEYSVSEVRVGSRRIYVATVRDIADRKRIEEEITIKNMELKAGSRDDRVFGLAMALFSSTYDMGEILNGTLSLLAGNHPYPVSVLYLFDEFKGKFVCRASHGASDSLKQEFDLGEGIVGICAGEKRTQVMEDGDGPVHMAIETGVGKVSPAAIIASPIFYQDRVIGVMTAASAVRLIERDRLFIERLCAQIGVAINNLRQYEDLKELSARLKIQGKEISQKNVELQEANKMKSEFLANMSHELRTPLNAVIGFSEVLKDGLAGELNPDQKEYASDIFESGHHLLSLVNDILDLAKIEAGRMTLSLEVVDVGGIIEKSISILRENALENGIRLSSKIEEGIEGFTLDARKFRQIIYNLLSNAVKFTDSGGRVDVVATMVEVDSMEFFEVVVTDTGIGIALEELEKLFTPFVQLDASMSRRYEGTGLGLAMVKRLMGLHNGTIRVESEEGKGTSFIVRFPAGLEAGGPPLTEDKSRVSSVGGGTPERVHSTNPSLALVVEDDDSSAELIRLRLEKEGFKVVRTTSAEKALEEVAIRLPDLIILDIILPGMDGWEFLAKIRGHERLSRTPVVIVSVMADENQSRGFSLGAAKVLQKPLKSEQLLSVLYEVRSLEVEGEQRGSVLVVDDDPKAVELVAVYLKNAGFEVLRAYGGAEAIELAVGEKPALIILDLMMPDVNGFDVVKKLSTRSDTARIPIIILTAKQITDEDRKTLNGGIARIVEKSEFNHGNFIAEVRRAMQSGDGSETRSIAG